MVIEASKVNDCGIYCVDCPRKSLTTEETTIHANNKQYCLDVSVYCKYVDFCRFLIEHVHTTDSVHGVFDNKKTIIDHLQGSPAGSCDIPTEEGFCWECEHFTVPSGMGPCADCGLEGKNFKKRNK